MQDKAVNAAEEQKKQIQDFLEVRNSRRKNVAEAKLQNEAIGLELQTSRRNIQELESQFDQVQNICNELQQHCNPVAVTLENCVQAKECIVHYYEHIRQQVKEEDELFKVQKVQLKNTEERWRQQVLEEVEERKKDKILAEKVKMEMDQKIEDVSAKIIALQQKNTALENTIIQKTAKRQNLVSKMMQELQELNEKASKAQKKNEELTAAREAQKSHITDLESSLQNAANDRDSLMNKVLHLQQAIDEARKRKQALSEGLEQTKARSMALEVANSELDSVLEQKRNVKLGLTSQLEQCEIEMKDMNGILGEIQDACDKKQEDIKRLQEQLQTKQLEQEALTSEYRTEITQMMIKIELEKKTSYDMGSELQREEQLANVLLDRLKEVRASNSSMEQQCQMLEEDIAKTSTRAEELQVLANEEVEREEKVVEDLKGVEISLLDLQNYLAESNRKHEEFILKVTREKCEADEELKSAQHGLQNSIASHECMVQETMMLVNESRQSYAQHIEMKEAALMACRNEFHSLTQQVETASAEKDTLEAKMKDMLKMLEVTVNELEEKLLKKRAEQRPQAASTPISMVLPQPEQVSSAGDQQFPRGILKAPVPESLVSSKQVQFFGLSSDSEISLLDEPALPSTHAKTATVKEPSSEDDFMSNTQKSQSAQLIDNPKRIAKETQPRKFFKSRSQPIRNTGIQVVQGSPATSNMGFDD
ncbi:myosin-6 isoform X2 [Cryptotermes secundus]|uniref:myosin-6 isoform X2 n=1 Tax=Cryptotermes secundus TaxID=105785 RepID=UPI000CD7CD6D|nr:myosin-6 isoform X2 [Cryptotermes secundus]